MPDQNVVAGAATAAAVPSGPSPAPQPASPPASPGPLPPGGAQSPPAPSPAPVQPAAPAPASPEAISPDQALYIPNAEGGETLVTMRDLVEAYRSRPDLSADELAEARTVHAALKGDQAAMAKLVSSFQGQNQPAAASPDDPSTAMQRRIDELEAALRRTSAVTDEIAALREQGAVKAQIATYAQYVPHLAKVPDQAAGMVLGEYRRQLQMAADGQHPKLAGLRINANSLSPTHYQVLMGSAMATVEGQLRQLVGAYGVTLQPQAPAQPPAATPANAQVSAAGLVNDQTPADPNRRPASLRLENGQIVHNATGQAMAQSTHRTFEPIPTDPVNPAGAGAGLPLTPPAQRGGPLTPQALAARMQNRMQQMANTVQ